MLRLEALPNSFLSRVEPMMDDRGCWEWTGSIKPSGYGQGLLPNSRTPLEAHRLSMLLVTGILSDRKRQVMHTCDNRTCVNPAHLKFGTALENIQDAVRKGRMTGRKTHVYVAGHVSGHRKLSGSQLYEISLLRSQGWGYRRLAKRFGVSRTCLYNLAKGLTYREV